MASDLEHSAFFQEQGATGKRIVQGEEKHHIRRQTCTEDMQSYPSLTSNPTPATMMVSQPNQVFKNSF